MAEKNAPAVKPRRRATGVEVLLREVLAQQAAQGAQLEGLSRRTEEAAGNAQAARELANRTNIILEEQNVLARLVEYRADVRREIEGMRQDVVAAHGNLRSALAELEKSVAGDVKALGDRIGKLEADYQKREGVKDLAAWLMKNAPWLFAGLAAFAAGLGFKDRVP